MAGPEVVLAQAIGRALGVAVVFVDDAPSFNGVVDAIAQASRDDDDAAAAPGGGGDPALTVGRRYLLDLLCSNLIVRVQADGFNGTRADGFPLAVMMSARSSRVICTGYVPRPCRRCRSPGVEIEGPREEEEEEGGGRGRGATPRRGVGL